MITFAGKTPDGDPLVFLGLSAVNVTRLTGGEPIVVDLAALNLPPMRVVIGYGETERHIVGAIERVGLVPPGTASDMPAPSPGGHFVVAEMINPPREGNE